jgi:hypothetical protein
MLVCGLTMLAPAAAMAGTTAEPVPTMIDGNPLNIWTDSIGGVQVNVQGALVSEWYPPSGPNDPVTFLPTPNTHGNAGFGLIPFDANGSAIGVYGKLFNSSTGLGEVVAGPTLDSGSPATITTSWMVPDATNPVARVTQVLSYTNGQRQFDSTYTVQNQTPSPLNFRANVAGDLAIRGTDAGTGFLLRGPPRFMGGVNSSAGAAGGFVEETPWSHFESNNLGQVGSHASDTNVPGGFDDSISTPTPESPDGTDNAAGVQWDTYVPGSQALAPNDTATFKVAWRFVETLSLDPISAERLTGEELKLTANVADLAGAPVGNQQLVYAVEGANQATGTVTTDSNGKATFSYKGTNIGPDSITAFIDLNGNGVRDPDELQAQSSATWTGAVQGQSAGVRPEKGVVKIKLPPGFTPAKAKRMGLNGAAANKFTRLTDAAQVPVGSQLDTKKGTVKLNTSGNASATKFNVGSFSKGVFKMTQGSKNPLTTLSMMGGNLNKCPNIGRVPKGGAARKRGRRLFGNGRGRFRTRGRNSSATVRGTQWQMDDTCRGTLTTVKSGTVVVRDFNLRKNKIVKKGHRYLAKARKRRH